MDDEELLQLLAHLRTELRQFAPEVESEVAEQWETRRYEGPWDSVDAFLLLVEQSLMLRSRRTVERTLTLLSEVASGRGERQVEAILLEPPATVAATSKVEEIDLLDLPDLDEPIRLVRDLRRSILEG